MTTYNFAVGPGYDCSIVECGSSGAHTLKITNVGSTNVYLSQRPLPISAGSWTGELAGGGLAVLAPGAAVTIAVVADSDNAYRLICGTSAPDAGSISVTVLS